MRWAPLLAALSRRAVERGLPRNCLAESRDKEDNESNTGNWPFVVLVLKVRAKGELGCWT